VSSALSNSDTNRAPRCLRQQVGLVLGPLLFAGLLLLPVPDGLGPEGVGVAATAALMAVWWITEAIPIPATALLPIVLFPALGIQGAAATTVSYGHHLIFLFLGGFWIAASMERWRLHERIALHILRVLGGRPERLVLGFMTATASLSMWLSNTATTMMMLPIATAVAVRGEENPVDRAGGCAEGPQFGTSLMLGIAYAASIGGVATLVGSPPNAIFAGVAETLFGERIGFLAWMAVGLPLALVMLLVTWVYLTRIAFPVRGPGLTGARDLVGVQLRGLGPMRREEKWVLGVFLSVAAGWVLRGLVPLPWLQGLDDSTIAMAGALALFLIPASEENRGYLLDWASAVRIPWDVILLFGGGFALARGFEASGLADWIGQQLRLFEGAPVLAIIAAVTLLTIFLTEVTSNTATASMLLPIVAALSSAAAVHPYGPMAAAALAASFAFMLPVATPPNAIVYGSRLVSIPEMARAGFWLNLVGAVLITGAAGWLVPLVWGLDAAP